MQTPPPTGSALTSGTPLGEDKANRLTNLLNSAMKDEKSKKVKSGTKDTSSTERIKELESRLAQCIKEYKKYKDECLNLKAERDAHKEELQVLSSLNSELRCTLEEVNEQLLKLETEQEEAAEKKEVLVLTHAKEIADKEKESLILENQLLDANNGAAECLSSLAAAKLQISDQEKKLTKKQEHCDNLLQQNRLLQEIDVKYKSVLLEMENKDAEIDELLLYVKKLQDLQSTEKDASESVIEAIKSQNQDLTMEMNSLKKSLESHEKDKHIFAEMQRERDRLSDENYMLQDKINVQSESLLNLEKLDSSLKEKVVECENLTSERDDLKSSLMLFEKEETVSLLQNKKMISDLQNKVYELNASLDHKAKELSKIQEDSQEKNAEICRLQEISQSCEHNDIALQEKKVEEEKLINALNTYQQVIEGNRSEIKLLNEELLNTKNALEEVQEAHTKELSRIKETSASNSNDLDEVKQLQHKINNLKQSQSELESIAAEKSLEAMDFKEQVEKLREEITLEKENLKKINTANKQHVSEIATGRKALELAEKKISELQRVTVKQSPDDNKRIQTLKTQKEATQRRAEIAEGKLHTTSSQLADAIKSKNVLEKERSILEKRISRMEKEKEKEREKEKASENKSKAPQEMSNSEEKSTKTADGSQFSDINKKETHYALSILSIASVLAVGYVMSIKDGNEA